MLRLHARHIHPIARYLNTRPALYRLTASCFSTVPQESANYPISQKHDIVLSPSEKEILGLFQYVADEAGLGAVRVAGLWVAYKLLGMHSPAMEVKLENTVTPAEFAKLVSGALKRKRQYDFRFTPTENAVRTAFLGATIVIRNFRSIEASEGLATTTPRRIKPAEVKKAILEEANNIDFSVDALYFNIKTQEVEDFTGSAFEDFNRKLIRATKPALGIFSLNPVKLVRCIRLAVTLKFSVDEDILQALVSNNVRALFSSPTLSKERISHEVSLMLDDPRLFRSNVLFTLFSLHSLFWSQIKDKTIFSLQQPRLPARMVPSEPHRRAGFVKLAPGVLNKVTNFDMNQINCTTLGSISMYEWLLNVFPTLQIQSMDNSPLLVAPHLLQSIQDNNVINDNFRHGLALYYLSNLYCPPIKTHSLQCCALALIITEGNVILGAKDRNLIRGIQKLSERAEKLLRIIVTANSGPEKYDLQLKESYESIRSTLFCDSNGNDFSDRFANMKGYGLMDIAHFGVVSAFEIALLIHQNEEHRQAVVLALTRLLFESTLATVESPSSNSKVMPESFYDEIGADLGLIPLTSITSSKAIIGHYFNRFEGSTLLQQIATSCLPKDIIDAARDFIPINGENFLQPEKNPVAQQYIAAANRVLAAIEVVGPEISGVKPFYSGHEVMQHFYVNHDVKIRGEITDAMVRWQLCFPKGDKEVAMQYLKAKFANIVLKH